MKGRMKIGVVVSVFVLVIALFFVPEAQAACSDRTLVGTFGLISTGTRIGGDNDGPRATVGLLTADGHGKLSGLETKSKNGAITQNQAFTGTYTVNPDCTGSITITDSDETRDIHFVIIGQAREILGIQTNEGRVTTFILKKQ